MGGPDCKTPGCIQEARIAGMCQKCFAGNNPIPGAQIGFGPEAETMSRPVLPSNEIAELLEIAAEVKAWKSRSYVQAAQRMAEIVLKLELQ